MRVRFRVAFVDIGKMLFDVAVAALVPTMDAANAMLPTYVTTCLYFGGLFITFDKIPEGWYWFSWTSFLRYSWGAQMLNQYQNSSVGQYGGFYDTSYKNQTEGITAPLPTKNIRDTARQRAKARPAQRRRRRSSSRLKSGTSWPSRSRYMGTL